MTMWSTDVRLYQHYNRRLNQLISYRDTEQLPGDEKKIQEMRERMDIHFFEMVLCRLDRAHWEIQQPDFFTIHKEEQ